MGAPGGAAGGSGLRERPGGAGQRERAGAGGTVDVAKELINQLDWHWNNQLRPRLEGLTDREYFWEPAPGTWSLRHRGTSDAPISVGGGAMALDYAFPEPVPAPLTTIAWRLCHMLVGVLGARNASHFGGPPVDYESYVYPETAAAALQQLDEAYARWLAGVTALGSEGLERPCGPAEGPWSEAAMGTLVLHINREVIHHGAEVSLLRDLYVHEHVPHYRR
ncbi:DinB family protein [Paenarthrobacter sp. DKR-5]|nr:DinB family protein [Paenarthrobacter sp. DKR-5]